MDVVFSVDKQAAFYYWLQIVARWDDSSAVDAKSAAYYTGQIHSVLSQEQRKALHNVKYILQHNANPRQLLAELYAGNVRSYDVQTIVEWALPCMPLFETFVWRDTQKTMLMWRDLLQAYDFARTNELLMNIKTFLASTFDLHTTLTVYILPNIPDTGVIGHRISGTDFILLRPYIKYRQSAIANVVTVVLHEYIHAIESGSTHSRALMKQSYEICIAANHIRPPHGFTWKNMYIEALVYCFANNITGGYARTVVSGKPLPRIEEFQRGFHRLRAKGAATTNDVIAWASLCITDIAAQYIDEGKVIDVKIVNYIGRVYQDMYKMA
jgi:hypothetical protein